MQPSRIDYGKVGTNHGHLNDDHQHGYSPIEIPGTVEDDQTRWDHHHEDCECEEHGYCQNGDCDDLCELSHPYSEEREEPEKKTKIDIFAKALSWAHGHKTCQNYGQDAYGQDTGAYNQYTCQGPSVYSRAHMENPYARQFNTWPVYGASWGHGRGLETMGGHGYGDQTQHGYINNGYGRPAGWGHLPPLY